MDKVAFELDDGETAEFYVEEQTRINGTDYLLVTDSLDDEAQALILKDTSPDGQEQAAYVIVEDERELEAVSRVFEEMVGDIEIQ